MTYDPSVNGTILLAGSNTWVIHLGSGTVSPAVIQVGPVLAFSPSVGVVGSALTISTFGTFGTNGATYTYTGLPAGCVSQNAPTFTCIPTGSGNFRGGGSGQSTQCGGGGARAALEVAPGPAGPGGPGSGAGSGSWETWLMSSYGAGTLVGVVVALAVALGAMVGRTRQRVRRGRALTDALRKLPLEPEEGTQDPEIPPAH